MIWEQIAFSSYINGNKAVGVNLTLSFLVFGVIYIVIHDCIYESFTENYGGHQILRRLYLWKTKCITADKQKRIITVSNESKK